MTVNYSVAGLTVEAGTSFGPVTLLEDVHLDLHAGEILGLIGESGSGKTTTARAMIGLLERNLTVTSGATTLAGEVISAPGVDRFQGVRGRDIGMIFQSAALSLNPLMRVGSLLREVLRRHRRDLDREQASARIAEVLASMGFEDVPRVLRSYPHQLSGGMRQRVAIALAVVSEPKVVIADECTSALDVTTQAEVVQLLRKLSRESDASMLFVTHDLMLAHELCDRIAVMYAGHVVETGSAEQVVTDPQHPYTRALLRAVPTWDDQELVGIEGAPPTVTQDWEGCRFAPRCAAVTDACRTGTIEVVEHQGRQVRCCNLDHVRTELRPAPAVAG